MSCIYLKVRMKKYKRYFYCTDKSEEVELSDCCKCDNKIYKKIQHSKIKGKKHTRTKATDISAKVKNIVWLRDNKKCIFCEKYVEKTYANAHFIPRSAGGLGIEQNIFTACSDCHREQDNGLHTEEYDKKAEKYLKAIYKGCWNKENLIYKKRRIA